MSIHGGIPRIAQSSSLRDPCPSGTAIGYTTFNGSDTIFLICDAAFYRNREVDTLALGLGLGLGLPIGILLVRLLYKWLVRRQQASLFPALQLELRQQPSSQPPVFPAEEVAKHLSPLALNDFRTGNLTDALKEELMITRVQLARNLTEFVKYADQLHHMELAEYIERMNAAAIPPEIHRKAHYRKEMLLVQVESESKP